VLQGGGALGAYQAGVYQALHEAGLEPDWVIGTSIGAINASLIVGNAVEQRLPRLREFWRRVQQDEALCKTAELSGLGGAFARWTTMFYGLPAFFVPQWQAFGCPALPLGAEAAAYYSTQPLRATLTELIDFVLINRRKPRLTVGAANVGTGEMCYFDSRTMTLDVRHVMASGALPPAFPAVRIDGQLYWDGGILSNTPLEAIFDDNPRRSGVVFAVHIWNPHGKEPGTIAEVMTRQKDIQYASRTDAQVVRQKQLHRLRHVICELAARLPEEARQCPEVRELAAWGCTTRMHVVRLQAPVLDGEDSTKDIDFSPAGIRARWEAGYADTSAVIARAPWTEEVDPIEGLILHEAEEGRVTAAR
jgi:NTE family protein